MNLHLSQLARHLAQADQHLYWLIGDEPAQAQEVHEQLDAAFAMDEKVKLEIKGQASLELFQAELASPSLFAKRRYFKLKVPAKLSKIELKHLSQILSPTATDCIFLHSSKLAAEWQAQPDFKIIESQCVFIKAQKLDAYELPRYVSMRLSRAGYNLSPEALELLLLSIEGNLIAINQIIQRLRLLQAPKALEAADLSPCLGEAASYSLFDLSDALLASDQARTLNILHHFEQVGFEGILVLWALLKEIRLLYQLSLSPNAFEEQCDRIKIWRSRRPLYRRALQAFKLENKAAWFKQAQHIDGQLKGAPSPVSAWQGLNQLALSMMA